MPAPRAAWLLGVLALLAGTSAAGKFDHLTSCSSCIAAGLGWSVKKAKCGGYANRQCPEETPPPPAPLRRPPAATAQQQHQTAAATEPEPEGAAELYGRLPVVGQIARMAWDHSDPDFIRHRGMGNRGVGKMSKSQRGGGEKTPKSAPRR